MLTLGKSLSRERQESERVRSLIKLLTIGLAVPALNSFMLIELKQMKGAFKDAIVRQLFPTDFPIPLAQILSYLTTHQENVLFLLDGFDDTNASCLKHLQDILSGRIFRNSCVILTSRPGKANPGCQRSSRSPATRSVESEVVQETSGSGR